MLGWAGCEAPLGAPGAAGAAGLAVDIRPRDDAFEA